MKSLPIFLSLLSIGEALLLIIAFEDIKQKKISDILLLFLTLAAIGITLTDNSTAWYIHILGCAFGLFPMLFIRFIGGKIKNQEVLGMGDVFLNGILGLMLGLYKYLLCGFTASVVALVTVRIIRHKKHYDKMHAYPFSPFFLIGYTVSILFGDLIINRYVLLITGGAYL